MLGVHLGSSSQEEPCLDQRHALRTLGFWHGPPLLNMRNTEILQGLSLVGRPPGTRPGFPLGSSQESRAQWQKLSPGASLWGWLPVAPADPMMIFPQASHPHMLKHLLVEECMMRSPCCHLGIFFRNNLASNLCSASVTDMFISTASLLASAVFPTLWVYFMSNSV